MTFVSVVRLTLLLGVSTCVCTFLPPPPHGGILRPQPMNSSPLNLADLVSRHRQLVLQGHELVSPYARAVLPPLITANNHMSTVAAFLPGLLSTKGTSKSRSCWPHYR